MKDTPVLKIVNPSSRFSKVSLEKPTGHFYLQIAAEVDTALFSLFFTMSDKKKKILKQCKQFCNLLEMENGIVDAVVFKAKLIPPGRGKFIEERKEKVHIAKFDVAVLIEAKTLGAIQAVQNSTAFRQMETAIKNASAYRHIITATNVKLIAPVDHNKQGIFLFNYFFADDLQQNLAVWEYTAGWFQQETGLDNSTVLLPMHPGKSGYSIINHCRWDKWADIIPSLIFKKSFRSFVLDNFYANHVAAMPVLYTLA